ncbi:hypothetical protein [Fibrella arboris]|uniref:hypothetical protein n=1 Tax=Fibrella arboris TaxID=3242486 RepID=UPI003522C6E8
MRFHTCQPPWQEPSAYSQPVFRSRMIRSMAGLLAGAGTLCRLAIGYTPYMAFMEFDQHLADRLRDLFSRQPLASLPLLPTEPSARSYVLAGTCL